MKESDYLKMLESKEESRLLWFIQCVRERMHNCRVFFSFPDETASTFVSEIIVVAEVGGQHFTATLATSHISLGISKENMDREVDVICTGLAQTLGKNIFVSGMSPIPPEALKIFKRVDR